MAVVYRKCFVCSVEIENAYFLSLNDSSFMFYEILGISNWSNDIQRIKFEKVCYCQECLNRIINIRDMLEELKELEEEILQEKFRIKSELRESCTKSQMNYVIDKDGQQQQQPPGMLQIFREEIVSKFENISTQSTLRKVKIKEIDPEYQPYVSSENIPNEKYINMMPATQESLGHILQSSTSENKDFKKISNDGIQKETFDDGSLLKNDTKNSNTFEGEDIQNNSFHMTTYVPQGSNTDELKQQKSEKLENENGTSSSSKKIRVKRRRRKPSKEHWKKPKKCEECGTVLATIYSWERHKLNVHSADPKFKCVLCSFGSGHKLIFMRHMKTHSDEKKVKYKCNLCSTNAKTREALYYHMKTHDAKFQCSMCLIKFHLEETLKKHEILVH